MSLNKTATTLTTTTTNSNCTPNPHEDTKQNKKQNENCKQDDAYAQIVNANKKPKPKSVRVCTQIFKYTFSSVGLILVVFLYSFLGALMFQVLEQHEELRLCEEGKGKFLKEVKQYRQNLIVYVMYNASNSNLNSLNSNDLDNTSLLLSNNSRIHMAFSYLSDQNSNPVEPIFSNQNTSSSLNSNQTDNEKYYGINEMLEEFRKKIIEIEANNRYYGQDCNKETKWNFFSSLLFTITVMSTVGYGYIAPITWEGRVVCICYASIGIPIFFLCLTNLSGSLGQMLRFVYKTLNSVNPITKFLKRRRQQKRMKRNRKKMSTLSKHSNITSDNGSSFNEHKHIVVVQDGQSTIRSELSSNIFVKELEEFNVAYDLSLCEEDDEENDDEDDDDDDDENDFLSYEDEVPISVALLIIAVYFCAGAFMFQKFEGWTFTQSFYFIYVTLTTMGFGDLVPGQKPDDQYANIKLLAVCFYYLFGMSIIGMCLSVMQWIFKRKLFLLVGKLKKLIDCSSKKEKKAKLARNSIAYKEKEREEILNKIKMLQQYENQISGTRRKRHVLN